MNNGIFDFRKKIAFAAALIFVSHSLCGMPLTESNAAAVVQTADNDTGAPPEDNSTDNDAPAEPESEPVTYTVTFEECTLSENEFSALVGNLFRSEDICGSEYNTGSGTVTVKADAVLNDNDMYIGSHLFRRDREAEEATGDSLNIVVSTYAVLYGISDLNELEFTGLVDGKYGRIGSTVTVKPKREYIIAGSSEGISFKVEEGAYIVKQNVDTERESYELNISGKVYRVAPRSFRIDVGDEDIVVFNKQFPVDPSIVTFKWKDVRDISFITSDSSAVQISCNGKYYTENLSGNTVKLSNLLEKSDIEYISNGTLRVSSVSNVLKATFEYEGDSQRSGDTVDFPLIIDGDDMYYMVPYLENGNYYLSKYDYDGSVEVSADSMFSDLSGNEERFLRIDAKPGVSEMTLTYRKFDSFGSYIYTPEPDISQRSSECYTIDSTAPSTALMSFPSELFGSTFLYDYFGGDDASGLGYAKFRIGRDKSGFVLNSGVIDDSRFIIAKDILKDGDGITNGLNGSICFYMDRNAPAAEAKDPATGNKPDPGAWSGKDGMSANIYVDDTEECPLPANGTGSYADKYIKEIYDNYINAPTEDKQEIRSVIVGDYRFDRPDEGWQDGQAVTGYIENADILAAEQKAVNYLKTFELSDLGEGYDDQGNSYYYYKKILRNGVCDEIEKVLTNRFNSFTEEKNELVAADKDVPETLTKKLDLARKNLNNFKAAVSDYRSAVASAKSSYRCVPELSFDKATQSFSVKLTATSANASDTFRDVLPVYAVDNSDNTGTGEKADEIVFNYDGTAPALENNDITIQDAVFVGEKDGVKRYVLRDGTSVRAELSDKGGSGVDRVMWSIDGQLYPMDRDGSFYTARITSGDLSGRDLSGSVDIHAFDRMDNQSEFSSADSKNSFSVIIDNTAPLCSITDSSDPEDLYVNESGNQAKKWYSRFESLKMTIMAADAEPDICSGVEKIAVNINGRDNEIVLADAGMDAAALAEGSYYVAFDADTAPDSFRAVLRSDNDDDFEYSLGGGYYRLGRQSSGSYSDVPDKGGIAVSIRAYDFAGHESGDQSEKIFLELEKPTVAGVFFDRRNIINKSGTQHFNVFSGGAAELRVKAGSNIPISGISDVNLHLINMDGTLSRQVPDVKVIEADKEWSFTVPADFRGTVVVSLKSNTDRSSESVTTFGIITETGTKHGQSSSASIELPAADHFDGEGLPLYSSDIDVKLSVRDSFSGLSEITVSSTGQGSGTVKINEDKGLEGDGADIWQPSGDFANIITAMNGSIHFSDNRNGNTISLGYSDKAGHGSEEADSKSFSIDKVDPKVDVAFTDQGSGDQEFHDIYRNARKAVVTVTERNFDGELVEITVNGVRQRPVWNIAGGVQGTDSAQHSAEVTFDDDGVYTLAVKCRDMAGRKAPDYTSQTFTVDRTAPVLNVGFDRSLENEHYYRDNMTMTFRISDQNFDPSRINVSGTLNGSAEGFPKPSEWSNAGGYYTSSVKLSKDGEYAVNVSGRDKAGNPLEAYSTRFCIDTSAPSIGISDIEKANSDAVVMPRIRFSDTNLDKDSIKITLDGAKRGKGLAYEGRFNETPDGLEYIFDNFPARKTYDDIYTINASVKDNADNERKTSYSFSVNRFGSTFEFSEKTRKLENKYLSKPQDVVITEYNADKHSGKSSVYITKDSEIIELSEGRDYYVEHSGGSEEWSEYTYTIYASNFDSDAKYTVSVHSTDEAGNINVSDSDKKKAELTFFVDKTKPLCIPLNISENSAYKGENYTAHLSVSDNVNLKSVEVYINGDKVHSRLTDDECTFVIPNSGHAQNIRVKLTDMADNEVEYTYRNVLVTTSVVRLLVRRTWVKVAGISTVLLAGTGAFLLRRRRKNRLL